MSNKLSEALKKVVCNPTLSDAILVTKVDGMEDDPNGIVIDIPVSKFVLSARSMVFRRMFFGGFREGLSATTTTTITNTTNGSSMSDVNPSIRITNFKYSTMRSVVQYLYTDAIKSFANTESRVSDEGSNMATMDEMTDLYNAAHYFDIEDLLEDVSKLFYKQFGLKSWVPKESDIPSLCYTARHLLNKESQNNIILTTVESKLHLVIKNETLKISDLVEHVDVPYISSVINPRTVSGTGGKYWFFDLLCEWASTSEEHTKAAIEVLETIPKDEICVKSLSAFYDKNLKENDASNHCLITKDFMFEVFRHTSTYLADQLQVEKKANLKRKREEGTEEGTRLFEGQPFPSFRFAVPS